MTPFAEIFQATAKAEKDFKLTRKSLLEAAKVIHGIQSRAAVIAQATLSEGDREQMTTQFIRDMLRLQIPDGVSYNQLQEFAYDRNQAS
jgi:hypothetical protein